MEKPSRDRGTRSRTYRWVTALLGLLFVGLAVAILYTADPSAPRRHRLGGYGAALIVGGLGLEAVISAARNRPSILSRIGPLP